MYVTVIHCLLEHMFQEINGWFITVSFTTENIGKIPRIDAGETPIVIVSMHI